MRSADTLLRAGLLAALCALAGCGSLPEALGGKPAPAPAGAAPAASPTTTATNPAAAPVARAAPTTPVNPSVQRAFDDALRLLRAGRTDEAERALRALAQSKPEFGGPHANLGLIHRQAGKLPEAVAELERAVQASPEQPLYLNQLGIAYRQQGQFAKAREAYEKAMALDPNYAAAVLNLAVLHDLYLWDGARALALYERYLALSPAGDPVVSKWVADLKNRKPPAVAASGKEKS
ncbi:tetratricopeptide repeat protein [Ideonella sp. BN130291]|uniref:tetratricopeptide repeat protein n=1 Tax=Ideonella sp. BN130291 TaxID=3112940 RepID=UPI002E25DCA5|nr:tetratricopeptide repeat protein [Ideonella sp. BN130291]